MRTVCPRGKDGQGGFVTKYLDEKDFQDIAFCALVKAIYQDIRNQPER